MGNPLVTHNQAENRFEIVLDSGLAMLEYAVRGDSIVFYHTEVPARHEGRGVGASLAREALRYARERGLKVVPQCSFVAAYVRRHPDELPQANTSARSRTSRS